MAQFADVNPGKPAVADTASLSLIAGRIDNLVKGFDGTDYLTDIDINGGSIDGTPIGGTTPASGVLTTLQATGAATLGSTLGVVGATTLSGAASLQYTLGVTGATTLSGAVAMQSTATITGAVVMSSTCAITGALTATGGINTDGNETIKFDVMSFNLSTGGTFAHSKSTNIRGVSNPYISGGTATGVIDLTIYADGTNVTIKFNSDSGGTIIGNLVVFYV